MNKVAAVVFGALLMSPLAVQAAGPMKAGKWKVTIETEMAGMPMKIPAQTVETCVTKEQAEKPEPPKGKTSDDCKVSDYKIDGSKITWKMECPKQDMKGEGSMKFTGDSYEGVNNFTVSGQKIVSKMTGKRIGDCDSQ